MVTTATGVRSDYRCPMCGRYLAIGAPDGLCARCLLRAGIEEPDPTFSGPNAEPQDPLNIRFFGDYELSGEIGRGGMGVVYQARQLGTQRTVALKFLSGGALASRDAVHRFHTEARAAAMLEHPGIVPIYEAGMHDGQYFLAMRFVGGGSLAELAKRGPLPPRRAAQIIIAIAAAVQFAHARGVLHRDLKPGNILLDDAGAPLVSDFGLARLLESEDQLTVSSTLLGTVAYIAPEQAAGGAGAITTAADIYGLGAILYQLLAGKPPFQRPTTAETLRALHEEEPVPPSRIAAGKEPIPLDLETICLKCLEKQSNRRYAAAQEVADDLSRFLANEPVHARPVGVAEKLRRWCRRKPALAAVGTVASILLLVLVLGAPVTVFRINRARLEAERYLYAADMRLASEALRNGDLGSVRGLLDRHRPYPGTENLRGFEWRYLANAANQSGLLRQQLHGFTTGDHSYSEHSEIAIAEGILYNFRPQPTNVLFWDSKTWEALPLKLPARMSEWLWQPKEQVLLALNNRRSAIAIYRLPNFEQTLVVPVPGPVSYSAISRDLRTLAIAFQEGSVHHILVWDLTANSKRWTRGQYKREVNSLRFSADGSVLAAISADRQIGLWSVQQGTDLPSPPVQDASLPEIARTSVQFVGSNSTQLLLLNWNLSRQTLQVWDWAKAEVKGMYQTPLWQIQSYSLSPDGSLLAVGQSDGTIALLEMPAMRLVDKLPGNGAPVMCLAFSPSGRIIASGSKDRSLKLWDTETQRELATVGGNEDLVGEILFTPDERSVLGLLEDGTIKVWNLDRVLDRNILWRTGDGLESFAISPDERTVAVVDSSGCIHFRDRTSGAELRKIPSGESAVTAFSVAGVVFSPKGHVAAWAGLNWFGIVDYDCGLTNTFPISGRYGYCSPVFLPDGKAVAFASATNIMLWDVAERRARRFVPIQKSASVLGLAISPDGSLIAGAQDGGRVKVWEYPGGREVASEPAHSPMAFEVEFSADGRLLGSAGADSTAKIWEVLPHGLKRLRVLQGHVGWMGQLAFSPDGSRLVSSSSDDALKIWDLKTGSEVGTIYDHGNRFAWGTCFSKDGNTLYSANKQGDVRAWLATPVQNH